jgi:heme-degrading monooxygenase HmoA
MTLEEMDLRVPLNQQLGDEHIGPVILVNKFTVASEDCEALISAWADDAAYMKQQPGFIATQLHRGIAGSCVFLNYPVWESLEAFRTAFGQPEFRGRLAHYPASTVASPHLFEKIAVPGICVA